MVFRYCDFFFFAFFVPFLGEVAIELAEPADLNGSVTDFDPPIPAINKCAFFSGCTGLMTRPLFI